MSVVKAWDQVSVCIASGFFLSYVPAKIFRRWPLTGAGLVGAAWGWIAVPILPTTLGSSLCVLLAALLLSVVIAERAEKALGTHDDSRIVIDEFVGYWLSIFMLPRSWPVLLAGFILFRVFDVIKPWGIKRLQYLPGGWGVIADDAAAGMLVNCILRMCILFLPI